jgi:Predicted membrane protein (DUF2157)
MMSHLVIHPTTPSPVPLSTLLDSWARQGLITDEQARQLQAAATDETATVEIRPRTAERSSLVAEALGYVGGLVVLIATVLLAARYWDQVPADVHVVLVGGVAFVLLGAAFAVPLKAGDVAIRLRSVLLLLCIAAFGGFLALAGDEWLHISSSDNLSLLVVGGCTALAFVLWALNRTVLQEVAALVLSLAAAGNLVGVIWPDSEGVYGIAVWGVAAVWFLLGWGAVVANRQAVMAIAAVGLVFGSMMTMGHDAGLGFGIVTAALIITIALLFRNLVLLAIGAFASLQAIPPTVARWFPDSVVAPLALLVVGLLLVGAALLIARRRRTGPDAAVPTHDWSIGPRGPAIAGAASVAAATVVIVVTLAVV